MPLNLGNGFWVNDFAGLDLEGDKVGVGRGGWWSIIVCRLEPPSNNVQRPTSHDFGTRFISSKHLALRCASTDVVNEMLGPGIEESSIQRIVAREEEIHIVLQTAQLWRRRFLCKF